MAKVTKLPTAAKTKVRNPITTRRQQAALEVLWWHAGNGSAKSKAMLKEFAVIEGGRNGGGLD